MEQVVQIKNSIQKLGMIEYKKQRIYERNGEEIKELKEGFDIIEKILNKVQEERYKGMGDRERNGDRENTGSIWVIIAK